MTAKLKITKAMAAQTDPEATRYALSALQVVPDGCGGAYVVGTDSRKLTIMSSDGEVDETCLVPNTMFPRTKRDEQVPVEFDGETWFRKGADGTLKTSPPQEGRFPHVADCVPQIEGPHSVVCLDARLLADMQAGINTEEGRAVVLLIPHDKGAVETSLCVLGKDGFGVLMPCAVGDWGEKAASQFNDKRRAFVAAYRGESVEEESLSIDPLVDTIEQWPNKLGWSVDRGHRHYEIDEFGGVSRFVEGEYESYSAPFGATALPETEQTAAAMVNRHITRDEFVRPESEPEPEPVDVPETQPQSVEGSFMDDDEPRDDGVYDIDEFPAGDAETETLSVAELMGYLGI